MAAEDPDDADQDLHRAEPGEPHDPGKPQAGAGPDDDSNRSSALRRMVREALNGNDYSDRND
eukprot:11644178-Heterocapsa_arctica.AAC.1